MIAPKQDNYYAGLLQKDFFAKIIAPSPMTLHRPGQRIELPIKSVETPKSPQLDDNSLETYLRHFNKSVDLAKMVHELRDENGAVPSTLECVACKQTVYEPMNCRQCDTAIYCLKCTNDVKVCLKCQRPASFTKPGRIGQSFIDAVKVKCVRDRCGKKGKLMTYGEAATEEHYECCHLFDIVCPLCNQFVFSNMVEVKKHA